ncbi:YihY/virulence factor BrkB family protein [Lentilactobacillus sp. SPB1-3]|uniref:YihY/virulence factor BrkB family protein n=1 Tax=Lentilactobacillus terminaliae TaxID=3003483 RepID=A0ACD5DGX3_9LACO|nr:YihY/virulence factor BrkB family protein [Lentilactobacillus sp. SPB1-3]MCZ0976836.1 YihY/virulence factor BrkB family protein [Lentilactobacillus sp. SPB1-3]
MESVKPKKFMDFIRLFLSNYKNGAISDSAVVLAFYAVLAIFPVFFIVGSLLNVLNIRPEDVQIYLEPLFPDRVYSTLEPIIKSTLYGGSAGSLSIGLVVTIWSASRAIAAFQRTFNRTYGVAEDQSSVSNRIISFLWTLVLIIIVAAVLLFMVFGQMIAKWIQPIANISNSLIHFIGTIKFPVTLIATWFLLTLLFYLVPMARVKFRYVWVGALLSTIGLLALAQGFSIYLQFFGRNITAYKTIGTFIVLLFWLDFSALIMLVGGVLNATLQEFMAGPIQEQDDALANALKLAQTATERRRNRIKTNNKSSKKRPPRRPQRRRKQP